MAVDEELGRNLRGGAGGSRAKLDRFHFHTTEVSWCTPRVQRALEGDGERACLMVAGRVEVVFSILRVVTGREG